MLRGFALISFNIKFNKSLKNGNSPLPLSKTLAL